MNEKLKSPQMDTLMKAIASLENEQECYCFFEDLCTISELKAMAQRLQVARLLKDGVQYAEIVAETGASTATIARVNKALLYGADGYHHILDQKEFSQR